MRETGAKWWQFWKWHRHRCYAKWDDTGCWGECVVCNRRFGFVTREELRRYCDAEINAAMKRRANQERGEE